MQCKVLPALFYFPDPSWENCCAVHPPWLFRSSEQLPSTTALMPAPQSGATAGIDLTAKKGRNKRWKKTGAPTQSPLKHGESTKGLKIQDFRCFPCNSHLSCELISVIVEQCSFNAPVCCVADRLNAWAISWDLAHWADKSRMKQVLLSSTVLA